MRRMVPVAMMRNFSATPEQQIFGAATYEVWDSDTNLLSTAGTFDSWAGVVRGKTFLPAGEDSPPTVLAGGLGGHPRVNFAHNVDQQIAAAFGESLPQPLTYVAVFTWTAVAANNSAGIIGGNGNNPPRLGISTGNILWVTSALDIFNVNGGPPPWVPDSHILFAIAGGAGGVARVYRNGVQSGAGGTPTDTASISGMVLAPDVGFSQANALQFYRAGLILGVPTTDQFNAYGSELSAMYPPVPYTPIP